MTNYMKYRGKCKEMCEDLLCDDPTLKLVRGFYHCPFWGKQAHWWCVDENGKIVDPTIKQFPSSLGEYEEFDGFIECEHCGKTVKEVDARFYGHHVYCSYTCNMRDVGL